jgi:hypothetical protein
VEGLGHCRHGTPAGTFCSECKSRAAAVPTTGSIPVGPPAAEPVRPTAQRCTGDGCFEVVEPGHRCTMCGTATLFIGPVALDFPFGPVTIAPGEVLQVGRDPGWSSIAPQLGAANLNWVGRRHASLALSDGRLTIEHVDGSNPTYLNDHDIGERRRTVVAGDRIGFSKRVEVRVRAAS